MARSNGRDELRSFRGNTKPPVFDEIGWHLRFPIDVGQTTSQADSKILILKHLSYNADDDQVFILFFWKPAGNSAHSAIFHHGFREGEFQHSDASHARVPVLVPDYLCYTEQECLTFFNFILIKFIHWPKTQIEFPHHVREVFLRFIRIVTQRLIPVERICVSS